MGWLGFSVSWDDSFCWLGVCLVIGGIKVVGGFGWCFGFVFEGFNCWWSNSNVWFGRKRVDYDFVKMIVLNWKFNYFFNYLWYWRGLFGWLDDYDWWGMVSGWWWF